MSNENITFIGFGRIRDQLVLASVFDRLSSQEKQEIESNFQKFLLDGLARFGPGSREKRAFSDGTMFLLADQELCCIHALAVKSKAYPERIAFACLAESLRSVSQSEDGRSLNTVDRAGALTRQFRKDLKDLMDKYDKLANVDKTAEVTGKVDRAKGIMQENINKVIATHANIQELEQKTDDLSTNAAQFQRSAGDLRRVMWWRKTKITIMLVLVGAALFAYLVVVIVNLVN